jgi:hypothetical protein
VWKEGTSDLNDLVTNYFSNLFQTNVLEPDPVVINKVQRRVTHDMNESLIKPSTLEEVRKALFSNVDLNASGPYGLHAIFF